MEATGKAITLQYGDRQLTLYNQRCRQWTCLYDYRDPPKATLSNAGCGVFSVCHCGQWMTGKASSPDELAAFSLANGGRGDDGTDRPQLLAAMERSGLAAQYGFRYNMDGLHNDRDALRRHLLSHAGTALCNLRVGHIVALVDARTVGDEYQVLAIDPYSETADERISPIVREVIPDSAIDVLLTNETGALTGSRRQYAMYWASDETVRDFNLLHSL